MKKAILFMCVLFAMTTVVAAQRAGDRKEEIKKGLKEEVKLADDQITKVVAIDEEYRPKLREVKSDATLGEEEKKTKSKALNEEKKAKLETLLGREKAEEVQNFYTALRKKPKEEPKKDQ